MSIAIMSRLFKLPLGSCERKLLAIRLADFADDDGRGIYPGVARLARETDLSERTVQRKLKEFVEEGILIVKAEASGRPGQATRYDFDLAALDRLASSAAAKPTGDSVSPVETPVTGDCQTETGDTDDRDGCPPVTRTVIEPPIKPSDVRESASESASEGENKASVERAFMRFLPKWPTYATDSQPAARRAWEALTPDERQAAGDRMPDYLAADKAAGRKYHCSVGAYLTEKRWLNLPKPAVEPDKPKPAAPFGKAWSAMRMSYLVRPHAPLGPLPPAAQLVIDQKPEKRQVILDDHLMSKGWPKVTEMHQKLRERQPVFVTADIIEWGKDFQQVHRGGDLEAAWKRLHERLKLPWLPEDRAEWLYFPAIADGAGNYDEAVAAAFWAFKERIEGHVHAAAE